MNNEFFAAMIVADHNETLSFCENLTKDLDYSTYRPHVGLLQSRNAFLTDAMHYRSHQQEI